MAPTSTTATFGNRQCQVIGHTQEPAVIPDALRPVLPTDAVDVGHKIQVLDPSQKLIQIRIVRHVGKLPFTADGIRPDGFPINQNLPLVKAQDTAAGLQRGGLPCAVVSDKTEDFPRRNVQRQVIHSLFVTVAFCEVFNSKHMISSFPFRISGTSACRAIPMAAF